MGINLIFVSKCWLEYLYDHGFPNPVYNFDDIDPLLIFSSNRCPIYIRGLQCKVMDHFFSQKLSFEFYTMCRVDQYIKNGISDGAFTDYFVPFCYWQLRSNICWFFIGLFSMISINAIWWRYSVKANQSHQESVYHIVQFSRFHGYSCHRPSLFQS